MKGALGKVKCTLRQIWRVAISHKLGQVGLLGEVPRSRLWKGAWELAWWTPMRTFHSEEMVGARGGRWAVAWRSRKTGTGATSEEQSVGNQNRLIGLI